VLIAVGLFAIGSSAWNLLAAPGALVRQDMAEIAQLHARVTELEAPIGATPEVRAAFDALRNERVVARVNRVDKKIDGISVLKQCLSDLSSTGLCPETLKEPWYGSIDWRELLRFMGRLNVLGIVEPKTHPHTFNKGMSGVINEVTKPVQTFHLTRQGAAVARLAETTNESTEDDEEALARHRLDELRALTFVIGRNSRQYDLAELLLMSADVLTAPTSAMKFQATIQNAIPQPDQPLDHKDVPPEILSQLYMHDILSCKRVDPAPGAGAVRQLGTQPYSAYQLTSTGKAVVRLARSQASAATNSA
jgi:hypothetical protein